MLYLGVLTRADWEIARCQARQLVEEQKRGHDCSKRYHIRWWKTACVSVCGHFVFGYGGLAATITVWVRFWQRSCHYRCEMLAMESS